MAKSPDLPLRQIGWLFFLLSENQWEKSLHDFVTHRGVAAYHIRELIFEEGWDLVFQTRPRDTYALPVKGVVEKVFAGINSLAALIEQHFPPKAGG